MHDDQATNRYNVYAKVGGIAGAPWRIRPVTVTPNYCLSVTCNDGATGVVDMSQLIFSEKTGIYSSLKDAQLFNQVCIELGALAWSNGADFDPVWLHEEIGKNRIWCVPG
ncbi:MAG TPA: DUF2442 domain-containing protein [Nitrosomonas sp.]|nr:DUF2442 domain-containing protein [Nitrosomonas sp.]